MENVCDRFLNFRIINNYRYQKRHATHVRFLAGRMFEQLRPLHGYGTAERELLDALLERITDALIAYFRMQLEAGVDVLQIFDSWGGVLPGHHFEDASVKWMRKVVEAVGGEVPMIVFSKGMHDYSELHFLVIREIYNNDGITRAEIWDRLGKERPREDSAEADLYKLLIQDLSMGHVIRQHRPTDAYGNFLRQPAQKSRGPASSTMKSAFDDDKGYELTALGKQFVHYAMNDLPPKLEYRGPDGASEETQERQV